eukprot:8787199-Prorocentrum_lima.AAC.1
MYTDVAMYQLHLLNEDRDAWRVHVARADAAPQDRPVDKAQHLQRALQLCRGAAQRAKLYADLGHVYLRARNWDAAASMFTKGNVGFEMVCMLFLDEYAAEEDLQVRNCFAMLWRRLAKADAPAQVYQGLC